MCRIDNLHSLVFAFQRFRDKKRGCHTVLVRQPLLFDRGDVIRTRGLYVPNVALYQTKPHLDWLLTKQRYYALGADKSQAKTGRMGTTVRLRKTELLYIIAEAGLKLHLLKIHFRCVEYNLIAYRSSSARELFECSANG